MRTIRQQRNICNNLKQLRILHNLSQAQISTDTGIPRSSLAAYERCGEISDARLTALANYYEVSVEDLLGSWDVLFSHVPRAYIS